MKKRILALIATLAIASITLMGCGSKTLESIISDEYLREAEEETLKGSNGTLSEATATVEGNTMYYKCVYDSAYDGKIIIDEEGKEYMDSYFEESFNTLKETFKEAGVKDAITIKWTYTDSQGNELYTFSATK